MFSIWVQHRTCLDLCVSVDIRVFTELLVHLLSNLDRDRVDFLVLMNTMSQERLDGNSFLAQMSTCPFQTNVQQDIED